jgi:hypothetical protein
VSAAFCRARIATQPVSSNMSVIMLRFMSAKLGHYMQRRKFRGQTANYRATCLGLRTKCNDLGRMTKQIERGHHPTNDRSLAT